MDPWAVAVGAYVIARLVARVALVLAEARRLRARAELASVVAELPPGTELTGGRGRSAWAISVPAAPVHLVTVDVSDHATQGDPRAAAAAKR